MNLLEKLFPSLALSRQQARVQIKLLKRYYEAAKPSDFRKSFRASQSSNESVRQGAKNMRDYARYLDDNHDLVIGILDTLVNKIVGAGIPVSPTVKNKDGTLATEFNASIATMFDAWKVRPEASRTLPYNEMMRQICRAWLRDGEMFIQRIAGLTPKLLHATSVPYSLELIEADMLPMDLDESTPKQIIQGIELNDWNRPIAYYILKSKPGVRLSLLTRKENTKRVKAENIFHIKFSRRFTQVRGVSMLHGVLTRLDDLKNYEESERIAAQVAASMTGYIKKSPDVLIDQAVGTPDPAKNREFQMSPGMIFDDLLPGEEVGTISSDRPNTGLTDFRNGQLKAVAAGTGTGYASLSKNYDGSYSAQRQQSTDDLPGYEKLREYFVSMIVRPMYNELLDMALMSRSVIVPQTVDVSTLYSVDIRGVLQPWIDPKKEIEADVIAIDNGIRARVDVIRQRGGDPVETDKKIQDDTFKPVKTESQPATTSDVEAITDES